MSAEKAVGRGIDRVDGKLKVTGQAIYSADTPVANVLHAVIVGSSISAGKVTSIDVAEATAMPGVALILTHENAPTLPGGKLVVDPIDKHLQLLQDDSVDYDGHPVALVIAETLECAREAGARIKVSYAEKAINVDLEKETSSPITPKSMPGRPGPDSSRGDFDKAFASAAVKLEATYRTPIENHNPMEPHATVAVWSGNDQVTIYDATQGIFGVRKKIAATFALPPENVRVISHFVGGGFGSKGSPWSHVVLAALAARVVKRPVKLVVDRGQLFQLVGHRPETVQKLALAARSDGTLVAVKHEVRSHTSRIDQFNEPSALLSRMLYACDAVETSHRLIALDTSTPTFMRAPGESSGSFALESAMDELSYLLKMDPIELRLKNYADTDLQEKKPYSSKSLRECYRRGADAFGWSQRKPEIRARRDGRWLVGLGVATASYPTNQQAASATASLHPDGTATVLAGTQDIGTGTYTIMSQIAADALGIEVTKVHFDLGDTTFPETPVSGGSQTASSVGSAVKMACRAVREKLIELATSHPDAPLHGVDPAEVEISAGKLVSSKDPEKKDDLVKVIARAKVGDIEGKATTKPKGDRESFSCHSFGAHFAEVGVDPDLGEIRVRRMQGAFAAGQILNAKTARSQFLGGMVWGLGMALQEHTVRDPRSGRVVTKDLADYHFPVHADMPTMETLTVDEEDPHVNEIGAKGIGEIGIVGAAAAIANAVYHASGIRIRELPLTLDKIVQPKAVYP